MSVREPGVAVSSEPEIPGRSFWIGLALGTPVMVYGAVELVQQAGWTRTFGVARWFGGGILLHDLVLVPIVLAVVWAIGRWTPPAVHTPLRTAVLGTALVVAVGWPALRGYGDKPDNATIHPLDYGSGVLTLLALLWGAALAWSAWRLARPRDRSRREHRSEPIQVRLEHLEHALLTHRVDTRVPFEPRVVVGDERETCIREPRLRGRAQPPGTGSCSPGPTPCG